MPSIARVRHDPPFRQILVPPLQCAATHYELCKE